MSYPRPTTFNEVKLIKQCQRLEKLLPNADEALMDRIFAHLMHDGNRIYATDDKLLFYERNNVTDTFVFDTAIHAAIASISMSLAGGMNVIPVYTGSSDGDSGGSSGNNNNNNNNNNNA